MSPLKVLFTALRTLVDRLLSTPGLCLRTSTILTFLLPMKISGHYGTRFMALKCLLYAYIVGILARAAAFNVYLLSGGHIQDCLLIDPYISLLILKVKFINKYTVGIIGLMAFFAFYIDYAGAFLSNAEDATVTLEINIENVAQCSAIDTGATGAYSLLSRSFWASVGRFRQSNREVLSFSRAHLQTFPRLSTEVRLTMVWVAILSDTFICVANLLTATVFLAIWALQLGVIWEAPIPASRVSLACLDVTLMIYVTFNAIRMTFFCLHTCFLYTALFKCHLKQLSNSLRALEGKVRMRQSVYTPWMKRLSAQLSFCSTEHARILLFEERLNQRLASSVMFVTAAVNILVNAVVFNFLLIGSTGVLEKAFIFFMTAFQAGFAGIASSLFISMVAPLYASERLLYRAQGTLHSSASSGLDLLSAKLRLLTFFERVCTKKKFTFTAGTLSSISKKAVFEFFFGYSGFFLFIAKLLRKHQLGIDE